MYPTIFHQKSRRLSLLLLGLLMKRRQEKLRKRSEYIRPLFTARLVNGEYMLLQQLETDPFYHKKYFRMSKESFDSLYSLVEAHILHPVCHAYPIPPKLRLAITIRYLATGCSQIHLALSYKVSPSAVTGIIREVLQALINVLNSEYLPLPTHSTWTASEKVFREKWNFPLCVGALDGKHIRIRCPWRSGSLNFNYKGYFSIVVLAVVSGDYRFLVADIGAPGSESDAAIFSNTSFFKGVQKQSLQIPENGTIGNPPVPVPHVFVGDEAFPLKPWLLRPFSRQDLDLRKRIFNYRLSRARRVVENAFGIWAARWRILFTPIDADSDLIHMIVKSTIILHNFLRVQTDGEISGDEVSSDGAISPGNWRDNCSETLRDIPRVGSNNYSLQAFSVRENYTDYFCNDGRIEGQEAYVMRS